MASIFIGCAGAPPKLHVKDSAEYFDEGTIISGLTGQPVTFEDMLADLAASRVIYVGEHHTDAAHHEIQLKIIEGIAGVNPDLAVGMEMFDISYQSVLDQWSAGGLEENAFLEKVQWYANWRYDFNLYRDILTFVKQNHIKLVGLNLPSYIPSRVRVGGIENLLDSDRKYLPQNIDTTIEAHKAYVESIFKQHHFRGNTQFEYFYQAQCLWEDAMAETVSRELDDDVMVVLAGNGHIIHKYGVPDRAYRRNGLSFRTVYLATVGSEVELSYADYIWVTPAKKQQQKR